MNDFEIIAKFDYVLKDQSRVFLQFPTRNGRFGSSLCLLIIKKRTSSKDPLTALFRLLVSQIRFSFSERTWGEKKAYSHSNAPIVEEKHLITADVFPFIAGFFATMLFYN